MLGCRISDLGRRCDKRALPTRSPEKLLLWLHTDECSGCRLQFDTTLKKAVEFAESIDKNGPDTPTDMQARFLLSLLYLIHCTPSSPSLICMHLSIV